MAFPARAYYPLAMHLRDETQGVSFSFAFAFFFVR